MIALMLTGKMAEEVDRVVHQERSIQNR